MQWYIHEAYDGTLSMNRLIDALLNFSRMGHVEPRRETVDLSAMAHEAAAELKMAEPGRRVTFLIADGVVAEGDAPLLRVVLDDFLAMHGSIPVCGKRRSSNSVNRKLIKTSLFSPRQRCRVRHGERGQALYSFPAFPGAERCRGFGIGLATVERIIRRHGGKVWAEGESGQGATFYFSLDADRNS